MDAVLSCETSSTERPSRFAFCSSRKVIREVAILPGTTTFTVIPSRPTSRARVLDQPTSDIRRAFDRPRFGIGATTPDEVDVITRPQPLARIPGQHPVGDRDHRQHHPVEVLSPQSGVLTRDRGRRRASRDVDQDIDQAPVRARYPRSLASITERSAMSHHKRVTLPAVEAIAAAVFSAAAASISATATRAPSAASARAIAPPRPPPPPRTSAVLDFSSRSTLSFVFLVSVCRCARQTGSYRDPMIGLLTPRPGSSHTPAPPGFWSAPMWASMRNGRFEAIASRIASPRSPGRSTVTPSKSPWTAPSRRNRDCRVRRYRDGGSPSPVRGRRDSRAEAPGSRHRRSCSRRPRPPGCCTPRRCSGRWDTCRRRRRRRPTRRAGRARRALRRARPRRRSPSVRTPSSRSANPAGAAGSTGSASCGGCRCR
jgi:hypothetical protein